MRVLPFYVRLLRLQTLRPATWQRAVFVEGSIVASVLAVLADLASAWLMLVLPVIVAVAVKFTDLVATQLLMHPPAAASDLSRVIARDAPLAERAA